MTFKRLLPLLAVTLLAGCPTAPPVPNDPCEGVECGPGTCGAVAGVAQCFCDVGHRSEGLRCIEETVETDPCAPNPCTNKNRSVCTVIEDGTGSSPGVKAVCLCDAGYEERNGVCLPIDPCKPNPCTGANQTQCTNVGGTAMCGCDPSYIPDANGGCRPDFIHDCPAPTEGGDAFESDGCPLQARDIGTEGGQEEPHSLVPAGDTDWFRISAQPGQIYAVSANGAANLRVTVDFFSAQGEPLAQDSGVSVSLAVRSQVNDVIYVRVRAETPTATGAYTVSLQHEGEDDHADTHAEGTLHPVSQELTGRLQFYGDRDVMKLLLAPNRLYDLTARWTSAGITEPLVMDLIGPDGSAVLRSEQGLFPAMRTFITAPGEYAVRLRSADGKTRGEWMFHSTDIGPDDFPDEHVEATLVTPPAAPLTAWIDRVGDADFMEYAVEAEHVYAYTCTPTPQLGHCNLSVWDEALKLVGSDTNGGSGQLLYKALEDGVHTVRVTGNPTTQGSYNWRLEDRGPDDHGDTNETATPVTYPVQNTNGAIHYPGDKDVLAVTVDAARVLRVVTVGGGTGNVSSVSIYIRDAAGTLLAQSATGAANVAVSHEFAQAGTYFIELRAYSATQMGAYTWLIGDLGQDDHGDDAASATAVTWPTQSTAAQLETAGDKDFLAFTVGAGRILRFSAQGGAGVTSVSIYVRNSAGTTLAQSATGANGTSATVEFDQAGTYNVELRAYTTSHVGAYTWRIEDLGFDDHGDDASTATAVTWPQQNQGGLFETAGDRDFLSFTVGAGRILRFVTAGGAGVTSASIYVRNAAGTALVQSASGAATATAVYEFDQAGTYYVELRAYTTSHVGAYTWRIEDAGLDDHGDDSATATPVTWPAQNTPGLFETANDRDFLSFTVGAGRILRFVTAGGAGVTSASIYVRNAAGTALAQSASGGATASVSYEFEQAGTYFVELRAFTTSHVGAYTWRIEDMGLDDHGDTTATATAVTPPAPITTAQFETPGDRDLLSFTVNAGETLRFTTQGGTGVTSASIYIRDSAGTALAQATSGAATQTVTRLFPAAGTFYVEFRAATASHVGAYTWRIEPVP